MALQTINETRAISDKGCALLRKNSATGKYSLWLTTTNIPAMGAAPDTQETTVTTSGTKTYIDARQDMPQQEYTIYTTIDNIAKVNEARGKQYDFMVYFANGTSKKFSGKVAGWTDEISVGNVSTMKVSITVTSSDEEYVLNARDLIEPICWCTSSIENEYVLATTTGTVEINLETNPADATITATSDTVGVATVSVTGKKITVTGVAQGSALIKISMTSSGYASNFTYFAVVVPSAS